MISVRRLSAKVSRMYLELRADHGQQPFGSRQDVAQVTDQGQELLVFRDDLVLFEPGQPIEPHVENGLRLDLGEAIAPRGDSQRRGLAIGSRVDRARTRQHLGNRTRHPHPRHQRHLRLGGRRRGLDGRDHLVDVGERDRQALENVAPLARLAQIVDRAPRHHLAPMAQERLEHLLQAEKPRLAVDERDHVDAEHLSPWASARTGC